ncbi:hypothetical protein QWY97_00290 [Vibrio cortegadensis]|uniref:hypothetical protein n=1 Tax=Vibrio cortegadensis TaxID=1328770 RepID=UPI0021C3D772|nr:hypothetical protein [Vibrio cortegadensis]MDN3695794.1 hypothetical protein [Vibrio cortegadensis]
MNEAPHDNQTLKQGLMILLDDIDIRRKLDQIFTESLDTISTENLQRDAFDSVVESPSTCFGQDNSDMYEENSIQIANSQDSQLIEQIKGENQEMKAVIEKLKSLLGLKEAALNENNLTITKLNHGKNALESDLSNLKSELHKKNQTLSDINEQHRTVQVKLRSLTNTHEYQEQKIAFYRDSFEEDLRIKELYEDLSFQTKKSTEGIFKDTSIQGLIACGIQEKNISNFWDYVKSEVVNGHNPDQERIIILFELLFKRFQLAYPMFERQAVKVADKFDTQSHIKHNSSVNMSGNIRNILFFGYINIKSGKVIKPSVVII